jgi:hypothetical protein
MTLRIGFDMDGVLADFESAFRECDRRIFGPDARDTVGAPEIEEERQAAAAKAETDVDGEGRGSAARGLRRREDAVWKAIESTENFWATLKPLDPDAVRRIHLLMIRHRWEVFFITQRPETAGDTVQRQTQRWLVDQGFDLPSVLVIRGSRGSAAQALRLDYHVDDSPQNCHDVVSESSAKPILIVPATFDTAIASARLLGIGNAATIASALDILDQATQARMNPTLLSRLASMVGWK